MIGNKTYGDCGQTWLQISSFTSTTCIFLVRLTFYEIQNVLPYLLGLAEPSLFEHCTLQRKFCVFKEYIS